MINDDYYILYFVSVIMMIVVIKANTPSEKITIIMYIVHASSRY